MTSFSLRRCAAVAVLAAIAGRRSAQVPSSDEALIRAARERSNKAIAAHDTAAIASVWLPEYVSVSSTNTRSIGRDSARANFARLIGTRAGVVFTRTPAAITVNAVWGQAAESGRWVGRWTQTDGNTLVSGVYFAKWKKTVGGWFVLSETFVQLECSGTSYCDTPPP